MENVMIDIRNNGFLQRQFKGKDFVSLEEIISKYEDAVLDVERLTEEYEDLKNYNEDDDRDGYYADIAYEEMRLNEK